MELVRERLLRATGALEAAGVPYAVAGGNAVAAWAASVDPTAVRNTQDVDILFRRSDLDAASKALESVGFVRRHVDGSDVFLDGPQAKMRDAVHAVPACEKIWPEYLIASHDVTESEKPDQFRIVSLDALVRMKLTSFRLKDRVHVRDMLDVGLIDESWLTRFPPELAARLRQLIETPEG
ncbi:MAG TPA: hypothetical protein VFC46_12820 [Humisphaera sp.]|nr:hypothetical protein [Humisphaera sp.]